MANESEEKTSAAAAEVKANETGTGFAPTVPVIPKSAEKLETKKPEKTERKPFEPIPNGKVNLEASNPPRESIPRVIVG